MKNENVIEVNNIKKKFKVYFDKGRSLKEKVLFQNRNRYETRWVLNGISFNVEKGEAIGLIGHNGCGKSTTLKLLTKIMYPDEGTINIKGRISSLIELGAGFHPDMSGRENIYTNASIFGLTKKEIDKRMNDIIEFSELQDFLDNPVRTYSSGMYMRLAFSVAINVDADVLLIDEILAVGDVNFQTKCFEKLKEIKAKGTTIVIVSHSLSQIEQICDRTLWIEEGQIKDEGIPKYVHEHYLASMEHKRIEKIEKDYEENNDLKSENKKDKSDDTIKNNKEEVALPKFCGPKSIRMGNKYVEFVDVQLLDENDKPQIVFSTGDTMIVKMLYKSQQYNLQGNFGIGIFRDDGVHCYGTNVLIENDMLVDIEESGEVKIMVKNMLLQGKYLLDVAIHSKDGVLYDDIRNIMEFHITSSVKDIGVCRLPNKWIVDGINLDREVGNSEKSIR